MPPQKGKQPTKGAKQIVEENGSTVRFYLIMSLGAIVSYFAVTLTLFSEGLTAWYIFMNFIMIILYGGCYQMMTYMTRASYSSDGQLLDPGADLNMEGGMGEHLKDIVILTSLTHVLALVSNYFWLLLLFMPMRAMWLLWKHILGPWFFQEEPKESEQDEKKKKKMERKMKRYQ